MLIFSSLCNIKDAVTFQHVTESIIDQIESDFSRILSEWKLSGKLELINIEGYFDEVFYDLSNPNSFKFLIGDRLLIIGLANYVRKIVHSDPIGGFKYFSPQANITSNTKASIANECDLTSDVQGDLHAQYFLNKLVSTTNQNMIREKGGYRYDKELQSIAMVLRMLSGPLAYDTLQKNLSCALPALPSVNRYIHKTNCRVNEGVMRCEELLQYLEERNVEKVVALSEDATRIVGRVQYDPFTNQIMGFTLPINENNGLPIPFSFPSRNVHEMIDHFQRGNTVSPLVNVIMAKPVGRENVPAFCLLLYGTDNKYSAEDVSTRWQCIINNLERRGISVVSFASDSDPRFNTAMKILSKLGQKSQIYPSVTWFSCDYPTTDFKRISTNFFQDMPHIATKLRSFFLRSRKSSCKFSFGKYFIEQSHLKKMIVWFSKDVHNLTPMVLNPIDKQNYDSAMRICSEKVTSLLRHTLNGSQGTIKFLEIMKFIVDSFVDENLTPLQRIHKIWYSIFIIRMWREFVNSNKNLRLKTNFLTQNCYTCIELNAHNLVICMIQLKNLNLPHLFLPTLFNSQHCESLFRQVRSISSTFSTITNCSIKEFTQRISKIQLQSDLMSRIGSNFRFPRIDRSNEAEKLKIYELPTLIEIYNEIEKCKQEAISDAITLGLIKKNKQKTFDFSCKINLYQRKCKAKRTNNRSTLFHIKQSTHRVLQLNKINLKNHAHKFIDKEVNEESRFVEVYINPETNERHIYKKTAFCWLLRGDIERVSSDRLERVKIGTKAKKNKNKSTKQLMINKQ